jgi:tRNA dimethylallyltransferase
MYLAERFGLAIISADSRQVYRGFDIGTAKPTRVEQSRVPHYGIDCLDPMERYSAHAWATDAGCWRADAAAQGRSSIIVGGTGFYVRALVHPFDEVPLLDPDRRAILDRWLATLDADELSRWCTRLDPDRARLGPTQQRRAVETALLAGRRLSSAHRRDADGASSRPAVRYLVVDPGPVLASRIGERVQAMIAAGWIEEVRALMALVPPDAPAWQASGYRTLRDALVAGGAIQEAVARVVIETRQYAKRQRTWCRHQLPSAQVTILDSTAPDVFLRASRWWESDDESAP